MLEQEFDAVPLWRLLVDKRGNVTPKNVAERRAAVLAELDARLQGTDWLEALVLLANGAHGLRNMAKPSDLCAAVEKLGAPAAKWVRAKLPELVAENQSALRNSGAGMVLVWSIAGSLPAGGMLPEEYDDLFTDEVETRVLRGVLERMPPNRREGVLLPILQEITPDPWNGHIVLEKMLELADLDFGPAVGAALCELATAVAEQDSALSLDDPAAAKALRKRVEERFG